MQQYPCMSSNYNLYCATHLDEIMIGKWRQMSFCQQSTMHTNLYIPYETRPGKPLPALLFLIYEIGDVPYQYDVTYVK